MEFVSGSKRSLPITTRIPAIERTLRTTNAATTISDSIKATSTPPVAILTFDKGGVELTVHNLTPRDDNGCRDDARSYISSPKLLLRRHRATAPPLRAK